jgi:hypothetical protein
MDLDGAWEIGLAEIQYPHSWYNVKNNEAWLKVHFYKESELQKHLDLIPNGYYSSTKRIIKAIDGKKHRTELKNKFDMGFSEINHKINMKVKKDCQVLYYNPGADPGGKLEKINKIFWRKIVIFHFLSAPP